MSEPAKRNLSSTSDWLTGISVHLMIDEDHPWPSIRCRQCGEVLCYIDPVEPLWILADVARDHRMFCRDNEERL